MPIKVEISPSVTGEQRKDPRFIELLENARTFFNCNCEQCFNPKYRLLLALHEAGHAYFGKKAGAIEITFHGPTMYWDSRPQYDRPAISKAATSWIAPPQGFGLEILEGYIGSYIVRREMSNAPNDKTAIEKDNDDAREWFDLYVGTEDVGFDVQLEVAESEILKDLRSPSIREEIWAEAKRFEKEIFPAPKLTAAALRAKRLGWM